MKRVSILLAVGLCACTAWAAETEGSKAGDNGAMALFNGKDFTGWKLFIPDPAVDTSTVWTVKDGIVHCTGVPSGYMRTDKEYGNYRLTVEWRWPADAGNSGVLLHVQDPDKVWPKSIEAQLQSENAGDFWVIDGAEFKEHTDPANRRVPKMQPSGEKPVGDWNTYDIVCKDNTIEVRVNGVLQNRATETSLTKGYIALQSEGKPVEFRTIRLEPLKD